MSGGSYDYIHHRIDDFLEEFEQHLNNDPLRIAFCEHMKKIAKAVHDIEWVDSGDYGKGDEHEAIKACLLPTDIEGVVKHNLQVLAQNIKRIADE
jgi:hypothetical protein